MAASGSVVTDSAHGVTASELYDWLKFRKATALEFPTVTSLTNKREALACGHAPLGILANECGLNLSR